MTHKKDAKDSGIKKSPRKVKTITTLDDYNSQDGCNTDAIVPSPVPAIALSNPRNTSQSLVIESLIEQLICFYESDTLKRKKLFRQVCRKLSDLRFIDPSYHLEVFQPYRLNYRAAFNKLILDIRQSVEPSNAVVPLRVPKLDLDSCYGLGGEGDVIQRLSRYEIDFDEVTIIAKGGFGIVCKAIKRVDNVEYAIKKIPFTYNEDSALRKVLREVEVFAKLSHPNVVTYKSAWIEHQTVSSSSLIHNSSDETEYSTEMTTALSKRNVKNPFIFNFHTEMSYKESEFCCQTQETTVVTEKAVVRKLSRPSSVPYLQNMGDSEDEFPNLPSIRAVLFIQMELCAESLKEWLENRLEVDGTQVNEDESMNIFRQTLKGVDYLHSQGLIHRDLKPLNILMDGKSRRVKIGDFGLATMSCGCYYTESPGINHPWFESGHSKGVGTSPYAAPEQKTCQNYDNKADMYSLGIILLELFQPFQTLMERAKCFEALFKFRTIPEELSNRFPMQGEMIMKLVSRKAENRPSASELLKSDLFCTKTKLIDKQCDELVRLRQELILKDNEIFRLKQQLDQLALMANNNGQ